MKEEEAIRRKQEAKVRGEGASAKEDGLEMAREGPSGQETVLTDADLVDDEMVEVRRHLSLSALGF